MRETITLIIAILSIVYGLLMFLVPVFIFQIRDHIAKTNILLKEQNDLLRYISNKF